MAHNLENQGNFWNRKRKAPENLVQEASTIDVESYPAWPLVSENVNAFMEECRTPASFHGSPASSESESEPASSKHTTHAAR